MFHKRTWHSLWGQLYLSVPRDFPEERAKGTYNTVASEISEVIKEYIDTPRETLLSRIFERDKWGVIDMFRAVDRRLGRKSLEQLSRTSLSMPARRLLEARLRALDDRTVI